jgi:23S rRNA pseudouridine1911/1915/1917 synthase
MPDAHAFVVDADAAGARLDRFLAERLPDLSRARIQAVIDDGGVLVEGRPAKPSQRLKAGASVAVSVPDPVAAEPLPEDIPIRVLREDAHLLIVDKPAGLVVHPGAGAAAGTLVNALLHRVRDLSGVGGVLRPGIVHRLDKGTSGLILVAKDDATHRALARQFAQRTVRKEYLAIVHGLPSRAQGEIDRPIGRDPVHRRRMAVDAPRARAAQSSFRLRERLDGAALLEVRIHTGRTHQIRALASIAIRSRATTSTADGARPPRAGPRPARPCAPSSARRCTPPAWSSTIRRPGSASRPRARCLRTWTRSSRPCAERGWNSHATLAPWADRRRPARACWAIAPSTRAGCWRSTWTKWRSPVTCVPRGRSCDTADRSPCWRSARTTA